MTHTSFAVIGAEGVYLSNGARLPLPQFQQLGYWLDAATRRQVDTLWLHPSAGWRWRDADIDACDPWIVAGSAGEDAGEPWWTATRPGVYGVRDVVQPLYEDRAAWRETPDAATLRDALTLFRERVGVDWRWSPAATGLRLLRRLHSDAHATRLEVDDAPPAEALDAVADVGHLNWTRSLRENERGWYLHSYDVNAQYLAACASIPLGVGDWRRIEHPALPEKPSVLRPGYYRVKFSQRADRAEKSHLPPVVAGGSAWVTMPTVRLLSESGRHFQLLDSYTWNTSKRYLEPWYKVLRDARAKLLLQPDPASRFALDAVKGLYVKGLSRLHTTTYDRSGDTLYRPDWYDQVRALARANLLRGVYRVAQSYGAYPLAVGSDCVYYASPNPDPLAAPWIARVVNGCVMSDGLRISSQAGHYKVKDAGVPVDELAPYLRGERWNLLALQHALNVRAGRRAA